jgi:hypothetical protein
MATITISLKDILQEELSTRVTFRLKDQIIVDGNTIIPGTSRSITTNSSGLATIELYSGNYTVQILDRIPLEIAVPSGNGTYALSVLINKPPINVVSPVDTYEVKANKATNLTSPDDIQYPTTKAVDDALDSLTLSTNTALAGKFNNPTGTTSQVILGDGSLATANKTLVGLENVDNTSDVNKPVSTPQQLVINEQAKFVQSELKKNLDSRIRVTACFASYAINASGSTVASMTSLANDIGYNDSSDIKYTLNGALRFMLVQNNANPTNSDLNALTDFYNSKQFGSTLIINYETLGSSAEINAGEFDAGMLVLVNHIMAYKAANPLWNAEIIIKTGHETNLTATYEWAAVNAVNLAAAGGDLNVAIANWRTGFRRMSNLIRFNSTVNELGVKIDNPAVDADGVPIYSDTVQPFIKIAHEMAVANNTLFTAESLLKFNPGAKFYDIISFNPYNRSFTTSGDGEWRSFKSFTRFAFKNVAPIMAPGKDIMIGEMATMGSGRVTDVFSSSFTITNGGTGFPINQVNAPIPDSAITTDGSKKPTIRYSTNGSGVITSMVANDPGEEARVVTIASSFLGGTGLAVTVRVRNANQSKARWWAEALDYIKNETDVKYVNGFLENKGTVSNTNWQDLRDWAWNSLLTRRSVSVALGTINKRVKKDTPIILQNPNLCPDPFTTSLASYTVSGSNAGTLTRTTNTADLIPYTNLVSGVLSLTHNGVAGNPEDNQITFDITPASAIAPNQQCTAVVMAKFNPATALNPNTDRATIRIGMYPDSTIASFGKRLPPQDINEFYPPLDQPYVFSVAVGVPASTKWTGAIQVGQNNLAGTFFFTCIGFWIGNEYYPLEQTTSGISLSVANTWTADQTTNSTSDWVAGKAVQFIPRAITPVDGELYYNSVMKSLTGRWANLTQTVVNTIFSQTSTQTVGNTTTETSILGTGVGGQTTKTIPADAWTVGKVAKIESEGHYSTGGTPATLTFRVKLGALTFVPVTTATITPPASQTSANWYLRTMLTARQAGVTGLVTMSGKVEFIDVTTGNVRAIGLQQTGSGAVDLTVDNLLDVTVQWSAASASDTITSRNGLITINQ